MSKKTLDMYSILNKHICIETNDNEINECLSSIKKTHEMYGDKMINNINQEILKTIKSSKLDSLSSDDKVNFYHDCVILHAIKSVITNTPIENYQQHL